MKNRFIYFLAIIPVLVISLSLQSYQVQILESFSLRFNDINFDLQKKEINKDIVFVAVDEPSVNEYGRWPWNREVIAKGVDNLVEADVVLMDMIFSEPTTQEQDNILSDSISNLNASVCGFFLRHNSTQKVKEDELEILSDSSLDLLQSQITQYHKPQFISAPHAEINILPILEACSMSGSFSTLSQSDHLLRSYPISVYYKNLLYPSLAIQGLRLRFNKDIKRVDNLHVEINNKPIALNDKGFIRLNFYQKEQYKIVSFLDVSTGKIPQEYFKNKIVILGITEVGAGDVVSTPIGSLPGPLLHYTFLSNFLEGHLITEPKYISQILIICLVLIPLIFILIFKKILYRTILSILIYMVLYSYIRYLFVTDMVYIDLFYPLIFLLLSMLTIEVIAFNIQEKSSKFMKETFSSYLSKDLLNQLIANPKSLKLGGERKNLSILFSDIRGFTQLSESMSPERLIDILNRYFTPMTKAVLTNKGMLDKYIGDAVMAFFNAPVDVKEHADAACYTALEMIEKLDLLNRELEAEGILPIKIGIGLNTAEVIVGNIGSDDKKDYTIIGDGVNLASRVEGLTKNYGVQILITEFTVKYLRDDFIYREIEQVQVKGKDEAVLLYELMPNNARAKEIKDIYDKALEFYKKSKFTEAEELFIILVQKYKDKPSQYFLPLVKKKHPWGVHKMTTK